MTRLFISGTGAVSPAGWNVPALCAALDAGVPLPTQSLPRPGGQPPIHARLVPAPAPRPAGFAHPRLRRASPLSQYAAVAALDAVATLPAAARAGRLGLLFCLQSGPVQYACRFYEEALKDPATASPLVFPETVHAAPASHVAALLGNVDFVQTFVGDAGAYLQTVALAADWLGEGALDAVVVVGAEEPHWLYSEAGWLFDHGIILGAGAGALCLTSREEWSQGVEIEMITSPRIYTTATSQTRAAAAVRRELPAGTAAELLCDGQGVAQRFDRAERAAWRDWPGPRLSPRHILGEGFVAAAGWQCAAAADALCRKRFSAAQISIVGCSEQAIGARLVAGKLVRD